MFAKAFTIATLASYASAHMLMNNPKPYGNPDNSPLLADGSNFPCKGKVNDGGAGNTYQAGSTQQLSFTGQAVHGGGSCQVSLTTDKNPTKDSVWKVIKSIEGGCPAKNTPGNLGDNADALNPDKYDFTIPKELAAGEYTLAWTWFNHVGNREMYMNCAAVTIEGDGGSKDHLDSLPDMFVANIGNGCEVPADTDLKFPNPGKDVDQFAEKLGKPNGNCGGSGGSDGGSGGDLPSPAPTTNPGAQPSQPATTPVPTPAPGAGSGAGSGDGSNGAPEIPGGAFITVSKPAASQPSATQAPAAPETPDNGSDQGSGSGEGSGSGNDGGDSGSGSGSGSGNNGGDSGSGSGGFAAGTACTTEGEWNCISGSSFQRCASGTWTPSQGLSSGVTCTPGQGADISMAVKRGNQSMRRALRSRS